MSEIKILMVDDDKTLLEITKIYLEKMDKDLKITTITSAKEAFATMDDEFFDLIISDYQMPEMDGLQFLSMVRGSGNNIPFIMFTGKGREEVAIQALNNGADYYLQKGGETKSQFHELLNLINKLISQKYTTHINRRLFEQQLSINKLAKTLGETRNLNLIYKSIFKHIYELMDTDTFVVSFFNEKEKIIEPAYALLEGKLVDMDVFPALPITHAETQNHYQVIKSSRYLYLKDLRKGFDRNKSIEKSNKAKDYMKSALFVPMKIAGELIGIIEVHSYKVEAYTREDIDLLSSLANVAAVAIQNARLIKSLQEINIQLHDEKDEINHYLNLIQEMVIVIDKKGNVEFINEKGLEILKIKTTEIIGKNWFDTFVSKEVLKQVKSDYNLMLKNKKEVVYNQYTIVTKDNKEHTISWKNSLQITGGYAKSIILSGLDLTEKLIQERELSETEKRYRRLSEVIQDGLTIIDNQNNIYFNKKILEITGFSQEEYTNMTFFDFIIDEDKPKFNQILKKSQRRTEKPFEASFWIKTKKGSKKFTSNNIKTIKDSDGSKSTFIITKDITEEKLTEQALIDSVEEYRHTIDSIIDPMHVINRDLKFIIVNPELKKWVKSLDLRIDFDDKTILEAFPFLDKETINEYETVFSTGKPLTTTEHTELDNGKVVITETRKIPIIVNDTVHRVITIMRDITREQEMEKRVQESEHYFRLLFEQSKDGIVILNSSGCIVNANQKITEMFDSNLEELYNIEFLKYLNKKSQKEFTDFFDNLKINEIATIKVELEKNNTPESTYEIAANKVIIGDSYFVQIILRDIHEKEKARKERRKHNKELRFLSKTSLDFLSREKEVNIYEMIGDRIQNILADAVILILSYKESTNNFTIEEISGLGAFYRTLMKMMRKDPKGLEIELTDELRKKITPGVIREFEKDYSELTGEALSKKLASRLMKFLGIEHSYTIPFIAQDKLLGVVNILMKNKKEIKETELLETLINNASVALYQYNENLKLEQSEKMYRNLVESMNDGLAIEDINGTFLYVNPKFCEMLHYSREELLNQPIIDFIIEEDQRKYQNYSSKTSTEKRNRYELNWKAKNGDIVTTLISSRSILDETNQIIGSFAIIVDITDRKQREILLKKQQEILRKQRNELEDFASTIAHDLRGKLQAITLFNSMIDHEYSDKIDSSLEEISSFIEDLLILAREGSILGDIQKIDLNNLVSEISSKDFKLKPDIKVTIDKLPTITGDSLKLAQVFENIFMNIVKHAEATEVKITSKTNKMHEVIIQDNGVGIPKKKLAEIKEAIENESYISFGLIIIKKIIKAHNGEFRIESVKNKGTTITLLFPK